MDEVEREQARRREELDTVEGIANRVDELGAEVADLTEVIRDQVVPLLERLAVAAEGQHAIAVRALGQLEAERSAAAGAKKGPPPEAS